MILKSVRYAVKINYIATSARSYRSRRRFLGRFFLTQNRVDFTAIWCEDQHPARVWYNFTTHVALKGASQPVDDVPPVGGHPGSSETPFAPARNRLGEAASLVNSIEFRDRIPRNGTAVHCPDLLFHLSAGICVLPRLLAREREKDESGRRIMLESSLRSGYPWADFD